MAKLTRWDNGETIHECDGDIRFVVESAAKFWISCYRANLDGANLVGASLDGVRLSGASLVGARLDRASLNSANLAGGNLVDARLDNANLVGATLDRANLRGANLDGASLVGASLDGANLIGASLVYTNLEGANLAGATLDGASIASARLPVWCKWRVSYTESPTVTVHIGCKSKSVTEWDDWFSGSEEFHTLRKTEEFKRIHANYIAVRAYLVAMGMVSN